MKLPADSIIAPDKITKYLLQRRDEDDKSIFLEKAGYTPSTAAKLLLDIREQILSKEAIFLEEDEYGLRFEITGRLLGPNGKALKVTTIWMQEHLSGRVKFITLFPVRRK